MPAAWVEAWRVRPSSRWAISKARATTGSSSRNACSFGSLGDRRRQRHRRRGILRHQLGEFVDLPVGHLQHAADVAQHAARLQRAEGDDLRDLIAAVALLHIADHFVAAVLAEVDIEVRHRHAFRIEEALEQQAEADRIEIGDGQRIGDQRAAPEPRPGPTGMPSRLGPLDEVGDDQEVARIIHAGDDIDLEGQPRAIIFFGHALGKAVDLEPVGSPSSAWRRNSAASSLSAPAALAPAPTVKRGRIGLRVVGAKRAALGDLDRRGQRFRNVGEQHRHFRAGLEAMIRRQLIAVGFGDQAPAGDAQQRIVRFVIVRGGEIRLVGRDQRKTFCIGKIDQRGFGPPLLLDAVALQFDIEPVAEQLRQPVAARRRQRGLVGIDGERDRTLRPAGQRDQAFGVVLSQSNLMCGV